MSERRLPLPQLNLPFDAPPRPPGTANVKTAVTVVEVPQEDPSERQDEAPCAPPPRKRSKTKVLIEALEDELKEPVKLVLTDNRSLLLSTTRKQGKLSARVHQMFLGGDERVFVAIARFLARGDKRAGKVIDAFVEESGHLLQLNAAPLPKNAGKGRTHDLDEIYADVNRAYFGGAIDAEITWGQAGSFRGRRRRSITLGSYDSRAHRITMHPALDHPSVPKICVARVVHHEMLHIKHPTKVGPSGRRVVHSRAFRKEEEGFAGAKEADAWIDTNLDAILRYRPGRR